MRKEKIAFRVDARKKKTLDLIAKWQVAHIKGGVRQAKAGKFVSNAEVAAAFARWRK